MEYITLQNTDLSVSRLCMGGCPMGGHGWGWVLEGELMDAVHTALDAGINFFDTADTYGLGRSELTLGKALGSRRNDVVIATKFGVRVEDGLTFYDNRPEYIQAACVASLRRLGRDYIDLYQVHYRDDTTPIGVVVEALEELRTQGKIRCFGLSNLSARDIPELERYRGRFATIQNEYSLACRDHEADILALSEELAMTPLTWGSLGQGILTGKYDKNVVFGADDRRSRGIYRNFHGEKLLKNLEIVEVLKELAARHGKSVSAVAIRYILDYLSGSVVLCGAKRPAQVLGNAQGLGWNLTQTEIDWLEEISR